MITAEHIPVVPTNMKRVNVAVEKEIYLRAKQLKIDIHTLFRMTLGEAVEVKEREREKNEFSRKHFTHDHDHQSTKEALFGAMAHVHTRHDDGGGQGPVVPDAKRLAQAAQFIIGERKDFGPDSREALRDRSEEGL